MTPTPLVELKLLENCLVLAWSDDIMLIIYQPLHIIIHCTIIIAVMIIVMIMIILSIIVILIIGNIPWERSSPPPTSPTRRPTRPNTQTGGDSTNPPDRD